MPVSVQSPADAVNIALGKMGYADRIGSLWDGSDAAKSALDCYAQTRDDLMRDGNWTFCQRNVLGTLLKSAPPGGYFPGTDWSPATYPPIPWLFSYTYPDDCLLLRSVRPSTTFLFEPDPQPYLFSVLNDNGYTPARRVICCNVEAAVLVYQGQVTNPSSWPSDFAEALTAELAIRLKPVLMNKDVAQSDYLEVTRQTASAQMEQG